MSADTVFILVALVAALVAIVFFSVRSRREGAGYPAPLEAAADGVEVMPEPSPRRSSTRRRSSRRR